MSCRLRDGVVQIEHARLDDLLAAEGEKLAGERGGASAASGRPAGANRRRPRRGRPRRELHAGVPLDDGEHVVEIVRDARGELADGLQLLRMAELLFEVALLAHVERRDERHGLRRRDRTPPRRRRIRAARRLRVRSWHLEGCARNAPRCSCASSSRCAPAFGQRSQFGRRAANDLEAAEAGHREEGVVHIDERSVASDWMAIGIGLAWKAWRSAPRSGSTPSRQLALAPFPARSRALAALQFLGAVGDDLVEARRGGSWSWWLSVHSGSARARVAAPRRCRRAS